jgi:hemoglobin-like flavoprotein
MTPAQIGLVKTTFSRLAPRSGELGTRFYQRLFQLDPRLQVLFHGDIPNQGFALFSMIDLIVRTLDYREQVVPIIYELGKRHAAYGVLESDYGTFRAALLETLQGGLEDAFTPEVEQAWGAAYDFMAGVMAEAHAHVREGRTLPYRPAPRVEEEADQ